MKNWTSPNRPPLRPVQVPEGIAAEDWESVVWQMQNRITTLEGLARWIEPSAAEARAIEDLARRFRFVITPYYASLMDAKDPECPIRRQVVPSALEGDDPSGLADPLDELAHSPVKNVIRVYPDRIAFCVNNECALYCRFCLRKRMVGETGWSMQKSELETALAWIAGTPEIRDVLLTGGDPLVFSDSRLEWLLEGTGHFRVPIERGIEIFRGLRGRTSGFAIPQYVLDTPHGKVPLDHPYLHGREGDEMVMEAWDGAVWREPNPIDPA
jgi:L-lysine 2,3-aminomutase